MPPAKRTQPGARTVKPTPKPVETAGAGPDEPVVTPAASPQAPETPPALAEEPAEAARQLQSGDAVLLETGGEAILLYFAGPWAFVRVGTGHNWPLRVAAESLTAVDQVDETDLHRKFRKDALKRGEI